MSECISDCCTCVCERLQNNLVRNVHITTVCVCLGSEILFNFVSTEARDLYLLEGHHVKLDIYGHEDLRREEIDFVHWSFHGQVVRYYPGKENVYVPDDRVKFDSTNFSMILKNLQKSDSGLYRGEIGASDNLLSIEYNLSVLGAFLV